MRKALLVILVVTAYSAYAQVGSGTTIVIYFTQDKMIMAADSREVSPGWPLGGPPDDGKCKLAAFRDDLVFTSAGATKYESALLSWTSVDVAKKVIEINKGDRGKLHLDQIVRSWADVIVKNWRFVYAFRPNVVTQYSRLHDGLLTSGFFATHKNRDVATSFVAIVLKNGKIYWYPGKLSCVGESLCAMGKTDIFNEFASARTERAKAEISNWVKASSPPAEYSVGHKAG